MTMIASEREELITINKVLLTPGSVKVNPLIHDKGYGSPYSVKATIDRDIKPDDLELFKAIKSGELPTRHQMKAQSGVKVTAKKKFRIPFYKLSKHTINEITPRMSSKSLFIYDEYIKVKNDADVNQYWDKLMDEEEKLIQDGQKIDNIHSMQALKYKSEVFTPSIIAKYGKNISLYSSNSLYNYR